MAPNKVDDPRYRTLTLRVTREEKALLEQQHRERGMNLSQYLRLRIFGDAGGRAGR
jgi:hypothetical protein